MSDIKRVDSLKSPASGNADAGSIRRSSPRNISFNKGDLLTVSVERVLSPEKVLISIGGRMVTAETTTPLIEGDKIQVVVEKRTPSLLLRPVKVSLDMTGLLTASVRKAPPWDIDIGKLFSRLLTESALKESTDFFSTLKNYVLAESAIAGGGQYGAERIRELVKNSGLFLENSLNTSSHDRDIRTRDVKAALLSAVEMYKNADSPAKKELLNDVKRLLSAVESFQNINSINRERGESLALTLPFYFQGEIRSLKIFVNSRKKGEKKVTKNEFQISLMLELGALKKIRADIVKKRTDLFVTLYVEEEWIKETVQAGLQNLRKRLGELGFSVCADCFVSTGKYVDGEIPGREFISDLSRTINFTI